ncbi:MAG: hypothetical protein U9R68_10700, partial [Planctomycetota bacterium]|nr:hypothetical protein [Planctomycetota bacterium]
MTHRIPRLVCLALVGVVLCLAGRPSAAAEPLAAFDFTRPEVVRQWKPVVDVGRMSATGEGMRLAITGPDPHVVGPAVDLPAAVPLWAHVRVRAERAGSWQIFYFGAGKAPAEDRSVRFSVPGGRWTERRVPLPALGPKTRFRLDPPGSAGSATIAWVRLERRVPIKPPVWPTPVPPDLPADAPAVRSGDLTVRCDRAAPGRLAVEVAGKPMALGLLPMRIGYVCDGKVRWIPWKDGHRDPDGAMWRIAQSVTPGRDGSVDVAVRVSAD